MPEIVNKVRINWNWQEDKISDVFGFFSYNTGAPRWDQINMYVVDAFMEDNQALEWATDGCSYLWADFELEPGQDVNSLVYTLTLELQQSNITAFSRKSFYPHWIEYRKMRRNQGKFTPRQKVSPIHIDTRRPQW